MLNNIIIIKYSPTKTAAIFRATCDLILNLHTHSRKLTLFWPYNLSFYLIHHFPQINNDLFKLLVNQPQEETAPWLRELLINHQFQSNFEENYVPLLGRLAKKMGIWWKMPQSLRHFSSCLIIFFSHYLNKKYAFSSK